MPTGALTLMRTAMSTLARQEATDLAIDVLPEHGMFDEPLHAIVATPTAGNGTQLRAELHRNHTATGRRADLLITLPDGTTTIPTTSQDVRTTITGWLHTLPAAA